MFQGFRKTSICAAFVLTLVAVEPRAHASAFEIYGIGAEGVAQVSARAARATDGSASFYNPGALAFGKGYQVQLSPSLGAALYSKTPEGNEPTDPFGIATTVASDIPLTGPLAGKLRVGLALYALPNTLMRLRMQSVETAFFPYYDNRSQRLTVVPALSVRPFESLGIGVGANVLTGIQGPIDVREGQSRAVESRVIQDAGTVASLIVGARYDIKPWLHAAVSYRQKFGVPVKIKTTASVGGVPLLVDFRQTDAFYDPATVVAALGVEPSKNLGFELDLSYHRWSTWNGPLLELDTTVSALTLSSQSPQGLFKDSYAVKAGGAYTAVESDKTRVVLHAGAGYETSMVRADKRQGRTNFVDGPKTSLGLGATGRFEGLMRYPLLIGLGMQVQMVGMFEQRKVACSKVPCPEATVVGPDKDKPNEGITNPGYPKLSGAATFLAGAITVGVEL